MATALRGERVEIRMTRAQKRDIERAANLRGTSITDFILEAVQPAATEAIREFEVLELRNEDRRVFVEALLNPPEPNEAFKTAVARHKRMGLQSLPDNFKIEPLGKKHDRAAFSCGNDSLDQYLKNQAGQAVSKNLAAVFVLTSDGRRIAGYYTLSAYAIKLDEIPEEIARKLTRMHEVPATLLGRLARSVEFRGRGIGEILLVDALKKAVQNSAHVASWAVIVEAKDDRAAEFYKRYGFISFPSRLNRLFLPMTSIQKTFPQGEKRQPEKALLDWIYLQRQDGLPTAFDELSLKAIDWKKLHRYALKFPKSVRAALEVAAAQKVESIVEGVSSLFHRFAE